MFVDAGYVYAQGSVLLKKKKLHRESINLSEKQVLEYLDKSAHNVAPGARLLRIYWYDGLLKTKSPSLAQDLIELARNRAISDALILSGDEDIKIGVQVAQTYGVRVHLLGIKPAKGSQSERLMMESDTCQEWDEAVVSQWMRFDDIEANVAEFSQSTESVRLPTESVRLPTGSQDSELPAPDKFQAIVDFEVDELINSLSASDLDRHVEFLNLYPGRIHSDIDRHTLASLRNRLGRDLTNDERKEYRQILATALRQAHGRKGSAS